MTSNGYVMGIRSVDVMLAGAGILGHAIVLLLLVRRHWLRRLPAFTLLIAFYLLRSALFLMPRLLAGRPGIYWLFIYMDPGLQLLVMMAFGVLAWRRRKAIAWAIPFFLIFAGLLAWLMGPSSHYSPRNLAIKMGMFVSGLWLQMAIAGYLVLRKGKPETTGYPGWLPLRIAFGFAAYSAINIVTEWVHMHSALLRQHALYAGLSYVRVMLYLCCLATWSFLFWSSTAGFAQSRA